MKLFFIVCGTVWSKYLHEPVNMTVYDTKYLSMQSLKICHKYAFIFLPHWWENFCWIELWLGMYRQQRVAIDGSKIQVGQVTSGAPQRCVLRVGIRVFSVHKWPCHSDTLT